jgi:hypothetical protein
MKLIKDEDSIHFKEAALVWLGDPCYAPELSDDWDNFCNEYFQADEDEPSKVMEHNGVKFVCGNTAYGDGCYGVSTGGRCGVDAGLLSVIPAGAFGLDSNRDTDFGGVFVTIQGECYMDKDGTLHAGSVCVHTGDVCENCGALAYECDCERCMDCGEFEDHCDCSYEDEDEEDE